MMHLPQLPSNKTWVFPISNAIFLGEISLFIVFFFLKTRGNKCFHSVVVTRWAPVKSPSVTGSPRLSSVRRELEARDSWKLPELANSWPSLDSSVAMTIDENCSKGP